MAGTYFSAQRKLGHRLDIQSLRLGMTREELSEIYGSPFDQKRNQLTYIFDDSSKLIITFRDDVVSSAQLKYRQAVKIQDPEMHQLTLVQMGTEENYMNQPSWFFAGKPEDGLIYKITSEGIIESVTWVPPFTYGQHPRKQLSALFHDFQSQKLQNL